MNKISTRKKHATVNVKTGDVYTYTSEVDFCPSQQTILNILNYSKALAVKKSKVLNYLEVVLN